MNFDITLAGIIAFAIDWIIRIAFLLYIPRKRKPSSAIAWLLVIFILPGLGILLFLIIGSNKLSKKRRNIQKRVDKLIEQGGHASEARISKLDSKKQQRIEAIVDLNYSLGKLPLSIGNTVDILPEYNDAIKEIIKHINKATEFVHLEYFIIALDDTTQPLFDALAAAVERGVKVRVLFDGLGYRAYPRKKEMKKLMTKLGFDWQIMLPVRPKPGSYNRPDLRNHRKIVVIDDQVAFIGSQNLIDRTYHRKDDIYYNELVAKLAGPIVRQCSVVFASDWFAETNQQLTSIVSPKKRPLPKETGNILAQILPSGPGYETENNALLFSQLMHTARKEIFITNPYFVPDEPILAAITAAAKRGVKVTLLNSESMDQWMVGQAQRSYYEELMHAGVDIYLHKSPVLLHSKHMTIDDDIAIIGSSNMDIRSFELDLECILTTYSEPVVTKLRKVQAQDLQNAKKLTWSAWEKRGIKNRFLESVARLTAALQ